MAADPPTWIVLLRPVAGVGVDGLLATSLGLDVWERGPDHLLAAVTEDQLAELRRRRLASIEPLGSRAEYEARACELGP